MCGPSCRWAWSMPCAIKNKTPDPHRIGSFLCQRCFELEMHQSISICTFLVSARKVPQRSRLKEALRANAPSLRIHPPHRHPAFKNVPIFERLRFTNLKVCSAEPAENRDIFSGRWSKAAGVGSGARMRFARNASPRTISLVTFLFGHKKVTHNIT